MKNLIDSRRGPRGFESRAVPHLQRAKAAGVGWPLPEGWDEEKLETTLFAGQQPRPSDPGKAAPDFAAMHEQKQRHRHLTLQLLWDEFRQANPEGYGYSRFCELYQRWRGKLDVVLRQEPPQAGHLFVAVLGASSYTYAEATHDEQLSNWIGAHVRAFEFYQGAPALIVPDNTKTGVTRACRYDPDLNPAYQEMAMHYGVGVVPARPYKPRDKAKVESCVQVVERWIVAALRHHRFFALAEVNVEIRRLLEAGLFERIRNSRGATRGRSKSMDRTSSVPRRHSMLLRRIPV
jgi:transposase